VNVRDYDPTVARVLIVGGGCRGRRLASELVGEGHAVRVTSRSETRRTAIDGAGAELWLGTPMRLETLRGALENVTIACWLLGSANAEPEALRELYGSRLEAFVRLLIDTTVRGFIYEPPSAALPAELARGGERVVSELTRHNQIPHAVILANPSELDSWLEEARVAVNRLLAG
jgi:hypothetical protein